MTKSGYVRLAEDIRIDRKHLSAEERVGYDMAVRTLCDALKRDNPRFDRAKFLTACEVTP